MGFGDVTLMMMIGTLIGWQAGVIVYFAAPFAGLVAGIAQLVVGRGRVIPYGPYLCLGTLLVVIGWAEAWVRCQDLFSVGWLIPAMLSIMMVLLWAMLVVVRWIQGN